MQKRIFRGFLTLLLLAVPFVLTNAQQTNSKKSTQQTNSKFAMTTRLFLDEMNRTEQTAKAPSRPGVDRPSKGAVGNVVAAPVYVDGVMCVPCFIHLMDPADLSGLEALGVKNIQRYDKLTFVTADVPVAQLEALAAIDNVTKIKVSEMMRPTTDQARRETGVTELLTMAPTVTGRGFSTKYDGSGVVLGVIDQGIDFQHIAFKDTAGNCRIKGAFVYDENGAIIYFEEDMQNPDSMATTDNIHEDHGTHTASTAGGSSVIVDRIDSNHFNLSVTNNHDSATFGGMAPGADLYLGAIYNLNSVYIMYALYFMIEYADTVGGTGKPLVVSNSWGVDLGPRNGHSELSEFICAYFNDSIPNHVVLFAAGNEAGQGGTGGLFVYKQDADSLHPLGAIIRSDLGTSGDHYQGFLANAWSDSSMNCNIYVLDTIGNILWSWTMAPGEFGFDSIYSVNAQNDTTLYYTGRLVVMSAYDSEAQQAYLIPHTSTGLTSTSPGAYVLAIEVYPDNGTVGINMWGRGDNHFVTAGTTTPGHTWVNGTDDVCVTNEATIPEAISVGAYVSKNRWLNYEGMMGSSHFTLGDIAYFSDYALAEVCPTGVQLPTIVAPGSMLVSAVNHYHTAQVDEDSYYLYRSRLVVNDSLYPYGAMQGTSMATPTAAGIVTLWMQAANEVGKTLTPNKVKDAMRRTATHDYYTLNGPNASHFGHGKIDAIAGLHFVRDNVLDLYDTAYNDMKIVLNSDTMTNVMLCGRRLYKDDGWNTLCLPFDMPLEGSVLDGATLVEMDPATTGFADSTLTLSFVSATSIQAGKPYLIKWPADTADITYPLFRNVTLQYAPTTVLSSDNAVCFYGIYSPVALPANDSANLAMGDSCKLYCPSEDLMLKSFRAFFRLNAWAKAPKHIVYKVNGEVVATGLGVMRGADPVLPQTKEDSQKFIWNGQLYIRRGSVIYDSLGRKVRFASNNR